MIIGIDASNINSGGGITHLTSLIDEITEKDGIYIKIWAPASTLIRIKDAFFIEKFNNYFLNKNIFFRFFFQIFILSRELKKNKCNILFVPGGTYLGSFKPFVTMCRNMLPFEKKERDRYKYSLMYFKLLFLRVVQLKTFKKANGVIFLSNYAQQTIFDLIPKNTLFKKKTEIIPHGINKKFFFNRKVNVLSFKDRSVIKCVYTSTIDKYKHQNNVIKAVSNLRAKNYKFELNLIGSSSVAELNKLKKLLKKNDPKKKFIFYQGALDTDEIIKIYKALDLNQISLSVLALDIKSECVFMVLLKPHRVKILLIARDCTWKWSLTSMKTDSHSSELRISSIPSKIRCSIPSTSILINFGF